MRELHDRLKWARETAGFETASDAAKAVGEKVPTYSGHENGSRGFGRAKAEKYARRYRVSLEWLMTGKGDARPPLRAPEAPKTLPLVGYVLGGTVSYFIDAQQRDEVDAPENTTSETVALDIRGDSLGPLFEGWVVYYDDVRQPVTPDLIGRLCVIGLPDGHIVVSKLKKSLTKGFFHLISQSGDPLMDVKVEWAALVKALMPR